MNATGPRRLAPDEYSLTGVWPALLRHRDSGRQLAAERGRLLVPARRDGGESPAISLPFVRCLAKRDCGLPPLFVLFGGPGGASVGAFETGFFHWAERFTEICDVVTFDQRGCHGALPRLDNPLRLAAPGDAPATRDDHLAAHRENARALAALWRERGVDWNAYNTVESAHDVRDLRRALGFERINLHGASYGSHLGLAVLKRYGEHVERAILCIVEGLDDTHKLPANVDAHFRKLSDLARSAPSLKGQTPDLYGELGAILRDFERNPLPVKLRDADGKRRAFLFGKFAVQSLLSSALGGSRAIAALPRLARRLSRRREDAFERLNGRLPALGVHGMMLAMDCASGATRSRLAAIESQRGQCLLDDVYNLPFPFVGEDMGVDDLGDAFRAPVASDVPTLFCSGALDGRTPIANAVAAKEGFANSWHVVVEGASHETPDVLQGDQLRFLRGEEPPSERLAKPFAFDPIDDAAIDRR